MHDRLLSIAASTPIWRRAGETNKSVFRTGGSSAPTWSNGAVTLEMRLRQTNGFGHCERGMEGAALPDKSVFRTGDGFANCG
jgi:hypothetical protein